MLVILRRRSKDIKEPLPGIANLQHARHVTASVAVIRRTPHRAQSIVVQNLVALLTQLVGAQDVVHVVDGQEFLNNLRAKGVARPAG